MISFRYSALVAETSLVLLLVGCSGGSALSGKFYENDGPPESSEMTIPDEITPRVERPHKAANRPYTVMGKRYYPMTGDAPFVQTGVASWYGKQFHGRKTAIGERYDMFSLSAAHPTMELPSYARVTNLVNGRSVIVRVNDRGPFLGGRAIDMSYAAAMKLGYHKAGTARVRIERLTRHDIAAGLIAKPTPETIMQENASASAPRPEQDAFASENTPSTSQAETTIPPAVIHETEVFVESTAPATQTAISTPTQSVTSDPIATLIETHPDGQATSDTPITLGTVSTTPSEAPVREETVVSLLGDAVPTTSTLPTWSCQVGAYSSEASAKEFAAHAEMMLSESRLSVPVKVLADGKLFRVLVGSEIDRAQARLLCEKINPILGLKAFLIQR